jgi:L-fucose mutarotase/ribose pyranase (RbsD/FucU family)
MLKSIDPLLNADVLYALRAMGHGDDLVICDTNFPADAVARETVLGRLLRIDNVTAARAARAILSVLPLDSSSRSQLCECKLSTSLTRFLPCRSKCNARSTLRKAAP